MEGPVLSGHWVATFRDAMRPGLPRQMPLVHRHWELISQPQSVSYSVKLTKSTLVFGRNLHLWGHCSSNTAWNEHSGMKNLVYGRNWAYIRAVADHKHTAS